MNVANEINASIDTLSSGVRAITVPLKERRAVALGIWVQVGGRHEKPRLSGISHFLEHIVFKGTKNRTANQIKEQVEGVGGSLNAFTSEECTCFLAKAAARHAEQVFDVLSDMVLHATMTQPDIEKERTVIMEEIKMTQDQPSQFVEEILSEAMWPEHSLGRALTGTLETVGKMTRDEIHGYRDHHYRPKRITVVASGAIDPGTFRKYTEARFHRAPDPAGEEMELFRNRQSKPVCKIFEKKTEQTHIALGVHAFPKEHKDEFALDLLSILLGGNMSSRLFNEVREERGLAYDIGSSVRKYHETGAFVVSAGVDNKKVHEAIEVILKELDRVRREAPGEDELMRSKEFYLGQLELGLENSMNNMLWVGDSVVTLGRVRTPGEVVQAVERVTPDDLRRVAKDLIRTEALNLCVVGPGADEKDLRSRLALPA